MVNLKTSLKAEKVREAQYSGGNVCIDSTGQYLFCIFGSLVNVIDIKTGNIVHQLESEEDEISCICLSPDDKHLITAHRNLILKQWSNWNINQVSEDFIAFDTNNNIKNNSNGGKSKETESKAKSKTTKCTRTWKAIHSAPVQFMCFDDTSTLLATCSSDYTTKIWDIHAQYCTHNLKGAQGIIRYALFYPKIAEKQQLITGCEDGKIRLYNLNTSKMDACLEGHFSSVTCFEYLFDEQTQAYSKLVSASRDKVIILWDLESKTKLRTVPVYESIESFFLAPRLASQSNNSIGGDRYLVTMGNEGLIKIWDLKTGHNLYKQQENESLKIVKKRQNKDEAELESVIVQALYNQKSSSLLAVTTEKSIVFYTPNQALIDALIQSEQPAKYDENEKLFEVSKQYIADHGEILDLQYCNIEQNLLAVATNSEFLKVHDLNTWDCKLLKGHTDLIICLNSFVDRSGKLSSNQNERISYLASSSKDSTIRVWKICEKIMNNREEENAKANAYSFECVSVCQGHTQDVGTLCFSNLALDFLVSGSIDTTIKLWKIKAPAKNNDKNETNELKISVAFTIKAHEKDINSIAVSPNDKLIASGSSDKSAKIWDATDGSCLAVLRGHKRGIWSTQFSPVDQILATSSADGTIKLWSLVDFSCIKTFEGHNTSVLKVHFLNHGNQLISTGSDGLIKLWSIKSNECVGTFDEHDDKLWALCVSKDEMKFVSGGADGKLIVWKDVTEELYEEELEKREEVLLKEQDLENCLKEKKWRKALGLAILLDKPFRCYEIIKEILQQTDSIEVEKAHQKGRTDLEKTLTKLRPDQIKSLLKYSADWNTNTKYCHLAQIVFETILKNYSHEFLFDEANNEYASKLIEAFLPYTERHYSRLSKLAQQIMFIDFAWQNMKLEESNVDLKMEYQNNDNKSSSSSSSSSLIKLQR